MAEIPIEYEDYVAPRTYYIHILNDLENLETKLFRLAKGDIIHFHLGPSLLGQRVHLYCNHPAPKTVHVGGPDHDEPEDVLNYIDDAFSANFDPFKRHIYRELQWYKRSPYACDETDAFAELELGRSGTFRYYFIVCDAEHEKLHHLLTEGSTNEPILMHERAKFVERRRSSTTVRSAGKLELVPDATASLPIHYTHPGSTADAIDVDDFEGDGCGYFLVDPALVTGPTSAPTPLPLDAVQCQTVLAKSLGRFDLWRARLAVTRESGFNAVHFTPVQELGISNSAYCIKDHFALNPQFYLPLEWNSEQSASARANPASPEDSTNNLAAMEDEEGNNSTTTPPQHRTSRSMSVSKGNRRTATMEELKQLVREMQEDWSVLSFQDVVWNHAATNCPWVRQHPESGYNLINSPHMKPAYLVDRGLWHFTLQVSKGEWAHRNVPTHIKDEFNLNAIRAILLDTVFPGLKISEFYLLDTESVLNQFRERIKKIGGPNPLDNKELSKIDLVRRVRRLQKALSAPSTVLTIIPHPSYKRMGSSIDMDLALRLYNMPHHKDLSEGDRIEQCCQELRTKLYALNHSKWEEVESHLRSAAESVVRNCRYYRLDPNGPRWDSVTEETPIAYKYYTHPYFDMTLEREEVEIINDAEKGKLIMAHNGWVMNDDPLKNFAGPDSFVFLRRELIVWGDNVKLRYGGCYEDNPFLWDIMKKYTESVASVFHGIRIDNCHSTPLGVGEYLIDAARRVRPNLYVVAELFTQSEATDNIFVNRFGITSLVREAMSAYNSRELGRIVHKYGGSPVGSFLPPPIRKITPQLAHAMLMDQTHDNPSLIEARSPYDVLPTCALVSMACCAIGSTRGLDEMVPNKIDIVNDNRKYKSWTEKEELTHKSVNMSTGIIAARRVLNLLHHELAVDHYDQIFVDQIDEEVIAVTRHSPLTHKSIILVAHTAFHNSGNRPSRQERFIRPLSVPGSVEEIICEASIEYKPGTHEQYHPDPRYINGLNDYGLKMRSNIHFYGSEMIEYHETGQSAAAVQEIDFINFLPGSIILFRVNLNATSRSAILKVRSYLSEFGYKTRSYSGTELKFDPALSLQKFVDEELFLSNVNRVLFRCDSEERDDGKGFGVYNVPGYGNLVYCGLKSIMGILKEIRQKNDLGHALCENLRNGNWMPVYMAQRLKNYEGTKSIGRWYEETFSQLSQIPRYLIPFYFEAIVNGTYRAIVATTLKKMSPFVSKGTNFVQSLTMSSIALIGEVKTSPLPPLSPNLKEDLPPSNEEGSEKGHFLMPSSAAGLPHFASGIFRIWGRDTFISLRGIFLLTGRFREARYIILSFASTLRHGLIPNLLGNGTHARYNCRDSIWWWLQSIQDYCQLLTGIEGADKAYAILKDPVSRMYPSDDSEPQPPGKCDQPLHDVMQEALQKHAQGLAFRERNAGPSIDCNMSDLGFNNSIGVDWKTGFVVGGNVHNCGTWMDKMGSSEAAGNKGVPATPRDGSAIELVALCKSALSWLIRVYNMGYYPYNYVRVHKGEPSKAQSNAKGGEPLNSIESGGVATDDGILLYSFEKWELLIAQNFEAKFWVPEHGPTDVLGSLNDASYDKALSDLDKNYGIPEEERKYINRRGIYKDCFGAGNRWTDYELRCNYPVAMAIAPDLFTPSKAWRALQIVEELLLGPLGIKTLDPADWAYNGVYDNDNQSSNPKLAHGFNYHQGPEWLWPVGYFFRAKMHFSRLQKNPNCYPDTVALIKQKLSKHFEKVKEPPWYGLPELTQADGKACHFGCPIQAWSTSSILETLYDMMDSTSLVPTKGGSQPEADF